MKKIKIQSLLEGTLKESVTGALSRMLEFLFYLRQH